MAVDRRIFLKHSFNVKQYADLRFIERAAIAPCRQRGHGEPPFERAKHPC